MWSIPEIRRTTGERSYVLFCVICSLYEKAEREQEIRTMDPEVKKTVHLLVELQDAFRISEWRPIWEKLGEPHELDIWFWHPDIEYQKKGACAGWSEGPVTETGWYAHYMCTGGCCRPKGPYLTKEAALLVSRRSVVEDLTGEMVTDLDEFAQVIAEHEVLTISRRR